MKKSVEKKEWSEFRNTGLLVIVNQILHIFGWAIMFERGDYGGDTKVYPARVKFRGFSAESQTNAYLNLSKYMVDNAIELEREIQLEAKRETLNKMNVPVGKVHVEQEELKYPSLRRPGLTRINTNTGKSTYTETLLDGRVIDIND